MAFPVFLLAVRVAVGDGETDAGQGHGGPAAAGTTVGRHGEYWEYFYQKFSDDLECIIR